MAYSHLQAEERQTLAALYQQGYSKRAIARTLGRNPSTILRELRRNTDVLLGYASRIAQASYVKRRMEAKPNAKLHHNGPLWPKVCALLDECWSPRQIAYTLQARYPCNKYFRACPETIYRAIYAYPSGDYRNHLISRLRQGRSSRKKRSRGKDRRRRIPDMQSIHVRPLDVDTRQTVGHWEGDLIKGEGNKSAVGVLVERKSRLVMLCKLPDASATSVLDAFTSKLSPVMKCLRQTLTYDQGKEMSRHKELTEKTGINVYFCDPHSPWQRGTCENTNGLLRQFLPKGTDLSTYTQQDLDCIATCLNNRPRAVLNWQTPYQIFDEAIVKTKDKIYAFSVENVLCVLGSDCRCASP